MSFWDFGKELVSFQLTSGKPPTTWPVSTRPSWLKPSARMMTTMKQTRLRKHGWPHFGPTFEGDSLIFWDLSSGSSCHVRNSNFIWNFGSPDFSTLGSCKTLISFPLPALGLSVLSNKKVTLTYPEMSVEELSHMVRWRWSRGSGLGWRGSKL